MNPLTIRELLDGLDLDDDVRRTLKKKLKKACKEQRRQNREKMKLYRVEGIYKTVSANADGREVIQRFSNICLALDINKAEGKLPPYFQNFPKEIGGCINVKAAWFMSGYILVSAQHELDYLGSYMQHPFVVDGPPMLDDSHTITTAHIVSFVALDEIDELKHLESLDKLS